MNQAAIVQEIDPDYSVSANSSGAKTAPVSPRLPPADWIERNVTIEDPQKRPALIPFSLWPEQRAALDAIASGKNCIVLKSRQVGLSWLTIADTQRDAIQDAGSATLCFSKDEQAAFEMVRRARGIFERIPAVARGGVALVPPNHKGEITYSNNSRLKSFAATPNAGSSFTARRAILDEFAKMPNAGDIYTSVRSTIADGGQIIIISTAFGESGDFRRLWDGAVAGDNDFTPIFIPATARPGRDAAWLRRESAAAISPAHFAQEYPMTPDEAFQNTGAADAFLPNMSAWDALRETLPALTPRSAVVYGLDLAVTSDYAALVGVTNHPERRGTRAARYCSVWQPRNGVIDLSAIESEIERMYRATAMQAVFYDPAQAQLMAQRLRLRGVPMREFQQGADRLEADAHLRQAVLSAQLSHDGNEGLRSAIANANMKLDSTGHKLRIIKRSDTLKIDAAVALSMALYGHAQILHM